MQYLGGKSRIARKIAEVINPIRAGRVLWDPFCGGLASAHALGGELVCSDAHTGLIALYQRLQREPTWLEGVHVSESDYRAARDLDDGDPWKAFVGFGSSFGAKWFGGYARNGDGRNYGAQTARSLTRFFQSEDIRRAEFCCGDFLTVEPHDFGGVLYLDPPYAGTTGYGAVGAFDHERFVGLVRQWGEHVPVFVSEQDFPLGRVVWEAQFTRGLDRRAGATTKAPERLYLLGA